MVREQNDNINLSGNLWLGQKIPCTCPKTVEGGTLTVETLPGTHDTLTFPHNGMLRQAGRQTNGWIDGWMDKLRCIAGREPWYPHLVLFYHRLPIEAMQVMFISHSVG